MFVSKTSRWEASVLPFCGLLHRRCLAAALSLKTLPVTKKERFQVGGILRMKLLD